jgi:hypothetical protein
MEEQINNAILWLKQQKLEGCLTGSALLGYFPDDEKIQDIDFFAYSEQSFTQMYYAMYHSPKFTITDPLEKWKSDKFRNEKQNKAKFGIQTIKFHYNTCIEVNIIYKQNCNNIFSVLSSFDMDIISKGYDTFLEKELDLTGNSTITKIADWNKWNPAYYSGEIWQINRILRQLDRCFKYYKRGYNVDNVIKKYIELIDILQDFTNIFSSDNFDEKLKITKSNTIIVRKICEVWLETHKITDDQIKLLKEKIKEI